jgi:hypothetical protein
MKSPTLSSTISSTISPAIVKKLADIFDRHFSISHLALTSTQPHEFVSIVNPEMSITAPPLSSTPPLLPPRIYSTFHEDRKDKDKNTKKAAAAFTNPSLLATIPECTKEKVMPDYLAIGATYYHTPIGAVQSSHFLNSDATATLTVPSLTLLKTLKRLLVTTPVKDVRYHLNGIAFDLDLAVDPVRLQSGHAQTEDGHRWIKAISTDGHRMQVAHFPADTTCTPLTHSQTSEPLPTTVNPLHPIMNRFLVESLVACLPASDQPTTLTFHYAVHTVYDHSTKPPRRVPKPTEFHGNTHTPTAVSITLPDGTVINSRLVDGRFPDYQRVIPDYRNPSIHCETVLTTTTLSALHRIASTIQKDIRKVIPKKTPYLPVALIYHPDLPLLTDTSSEDPLDPLRRCPMVPIDSQLTGNSSMGEVGEAFASNNPHLNHPHLFTGVEASYLLDLFTDPLKSKDRSTSLYLSIGRLVRANATPLQYPPFPASPVLAQAIPSSVVVNTTTTEGVEIVHVLMPCVL